MLIYDNRTAAATDLASCSRKLKTYKKIDHSTVLLIYWEGSQFVPPMFNLSKGNRPDTNLFGPLSYQSTGGSVVLTKTKQSDGRVTGSNPGW